MSLSIRAILPGVGCLARPGMARKRKRLRAHWSNCPARPLNREERRVNTWRALAIVSCHSSSLNRCKTSQSFSGTTQNNVKLTRVPHSFRYSFQNKTLTYCVLRVEGWGRLTWHFSPRLSRCMDKVTVWFIKRKPHAIIRIFIKFRHVTQQKTYRSHLTLHLIQVHNLCLSVFLLDILNKQCVNIQSIGTLCLISRIACLTSGFLLSSC